MKHGEILGKTLFIAAACLLLSLTGYAASVLDPAKEFLKSALTIRGGESFEAAVPMEFNRDYKLAQHRKKGEFEYFSIRVPPDSIVTLEARTFEKGVAWNKNGRPVTTGEPFAGLELVDGKDAVLKGVEIVGKPNAVEKASWRNRNPAEATHYILVGSRNGSIPKGQATFKVTISPFVYGDLGTPQDSGPTEANAFPIVPMREYPMNSIGGGDNKDVYAFTAAKKQYYTVAVRGEDPINTALKVTVRGASGERKGKEIVSFLSGGTQEVVTNSFKIPEDGQYFVEISLMSSVKEKSLYSLELLRVIGPGEKQTSSGENQ